MFLDEERTITKRVTLTSSFGPEYGESVLQKMGYSGPTRVMEIQTWPRIVREPSASLYKFLIKLERTNIYLVLPYLTGHGRIILQQLQELRLVTRKSLQDTSSSL